MPLPNRRFASGPCARHVAFSNILAERTGVARLIDNSDPAAETASAPPLRKALEQSVATSSTLGGHELAERCAEIEGVGETGCIADARSRVIAVEASYRTIEAALKAEIDRLRS